VVFSAAGLAIESAGYRRFWLVCGLAAAVPGLLFLVTLPECERYGGLSGLATGAVVYFCICRSLSEGKHRILWLGIPLLIALKTFLEIVSGTGIFVQARGMHFRVLPSTHIIGYLGAVVCSIWYWQDSVRVMRST